jgi:hypothetical protein
VTASIRGGGQQLRGEKQLLVYHRRVYRLFGTSLVPGNCYSAASASEARLTSLLNRLSLPFGFSAYEGVQQESCQRVRTYKHFKNAAFLVIANELTNRACIDVGHTAAARVAD